MRKPISFLLSAIAFIIISGFIENTTVAQTWTSIDGGGANGISNPSSNSNYPSVAVYNGEIYAIWQENLSGVDQIHIKKYDGSTWSPVGNIAGQSQLNTNLSNAWSPKIVACNGALYAAWYEYGDGITRIRVKKYDGSTWTFTENYAFGDGRTNIASLPLALAIKVDIIAFNNELYATWVETEPSGSGILQIRVAKFNGSVWSLIDGGTFYGINYDKTMLATNSTLCVFNNKLYAAWTESDAGNILQLRVKRYDGGSTWTFIDGNGLSGLNYNTATTLFDGPLSLSSYNGKMYAFWSESNRVRAKRYDETNGWVADPADGGTGIGWCHNSTNVAYYPSSCSYDKLYVTWEQNPIPRQVRVASYDGTTRTFIDGNAVAVGINNTTANRAHFPKLIEYHGDLAAIWSEELTSTQGSANQIRAKIFPLPPKVESVDVPAHGTYITGQTLTFTVHFSKYVNVSGGEPYIPVTLNTGGTVNATYHSGSGTKTLTFRYIIVSGNADADGITVGTAINLGGAKIQSMTDLDLVTDLTLNNIGGTTGVLIDANSPSITSGTLASTNGYIDVVFSEGVYGAADASTALNASKFSITFTRNGGTATGAVISSVRKNDNVNEGSASALTGGETTVRMFLAITGSPSGVETIEIRPAHGTSVYDYAGNAMSASQTTGVQTLNDFTAPTIVSASRTNNTELIVALSENCTNIIKGNDGGFTVCETGAPGTTYTVSSITQGVDAGHVVLSVTDMGLSGKEGVTVSYTAAGNGTVQDSKGNAMVTNASGAPVTAWDAAAPAITSGTHALNNAYIDLHFSEGVYGSANGTSPLTIAKFALIFIKDGGNATNTVISSVKKDDGLTDGTATALTGGETTIRVFLTITGIPNGMETIEIKPVNGTSIYDQAGNAALNTQTTGAQTLKDQLAPTVMSVGSSTADGVYKTGDVITITTTFSESVVVEGTPFLSLNSGGLASYVSGSGSNILTFNYTVASGNSAADLDYLAASSLNLSGGSIRDVAGNAAILILPETGSAHSLGGQKNILIGIVPAATTQAVTNISATTATGNGNITNLGYPNPIEYGVCWNTTGAPVITDNRTNNGAISSTGLFTAAMTNLASGTTFYVKAYVINSAGTSYGSEVMFTTDGKITYVLNGGTNNAANTETYVYGAGLTLSDPVRTGYTFGGWYDNETFTGLAITSISITTKGDVTLYAKWNSATDIDIIDNQKMALYPNPARDVVFINGASDKIYIYNLSGHLVLTKQMDAGNCINIELLPGGTYLVKVDDKMYKLIKK